MTLEQLKALVLEARKAKDTVKANLLGTLVAEATKDDRDPSPEHIEKVAFKFVKNIEANLKYRVDKKTQDEYDILDGLFSLNQTVTAADVKPIVDKLIVDNPEKDNVGWFLGQVMKETRGKANPAVVKEYIMEKLNA